MKFSEFREKRAKTNPNVVVFVCEDDFLVEESRSVWSKILGPNWVFEKLNAREFEDIDSARLLDEAQTPSLFSQNRVLMIANSEKVSKKRTEDLTGLQEIKNSSLRVILIASDGKSPESLRVFPAVLIDPMKPAEVARWLIDRYKVNPEVARHIVESAGTELYPLHNEMMKLEAYLGGTRPAEIGDVETSILHVESFGPWELDDALLERDYKKAVKVAGTMLEEGVEPLLILSKITRVWRQLLIGKGLAGKRSANEVAAAAGAPGFKGAAIASGSRKYAWPQLAKGFSELLKADRAFKSSSLNVEAYFDILLWKLVS